MSKVLTVMRIATSLCSCVLGIGLFMMSTMFSLLAGAVPQGEDFTPPWQIVASVIASGALVASGYMMFSLGWPGKFANAWFRWITALLLLIPLAVGCLLVNATRKQFPPVDLAFILIGFTVWLLLLCIKPTLLGTQEN
ncbi:hypothetical protein GJ697_25685 [Pseudoduganella sp. FT25W]|uniref:Uncharacterized protein n=1 Tax=Duganella alba TaxID=2666081 RepID=A0A6L5QPM2_9BURK|nr:hypothetical protein [Duganella alba]MRX11222.1 hypothetical protein [Duganella alba]MRX19307.1 hypothetical protein [Duganella alba]